MIEDKDIHNARIGARRSWRVNNRFVELDDLIGEAYVWLAANQKKLDDWREKGKHGENMVRLSCYRACQKFVAKERMARTGCERDDLFYYTPDTIADLLRDVWTYSTWVDSSHDTDPGVQRTSKPSEGNNRLAMLADVAKVLARLSEDDQDLLRKRFKLEGTPLTVLADDMGVHHTTVGRRIDNLLSKMVDMLGGESPWRK